MTNTLHQAENLKILKTIPDEFVDLIYMDPPFNTGKDFKDFKDKFKSLEAFIEFLNLRIIECHRALKQTGVFCLHLDYRSVHYLKIELDKIFGYKNFLNEIIWCYKDVAGGRNTAYYKRKHDTILVYSKSKKYYSNIQRRNLSETTIERFKKLWDEKGNITFRDIKEKEPGHFKSVAKRMKYIVDLDKVYYSKSKGAQLEDYWTDLSVLKNNSNENTKYSTQKPLKLLDRIIKSFSKEGDLVLDPFCGSGTTIVSAKNLKRNYIGIDLNPKAIEITNKRLDNI